MQEEVEQNKRVIADFIHEVELLGQLKHKCIVNLIGACVKPPNLCIITEIAGKGSLSDMLYGMMDLSWSQRISFARDVAEGVNYLHTHQPMIIHRDLKADNVLITNRWRAKVADFGLVKMKETQKKRVRTYSRMNVSNLSSSMNVSTISSSNTSLTSSVSSLESSEENGEKGSFPALTKSALLASPRNPHQSSTEDKIKFQETSLCGTPAWMAPELMDMLPYNEKVDVYAYGIFLWELLMREPPYKKRELATMMKLVGGGTSKRPTVPSFCPPLFAKLMTSCWAQKASDRPSMKQVILMWDEIQEKEGGFVSPNSLPNRVKKGWEPSALDKEEDN